MANKLTNEEVEKLHKMYSEGMTCEKIAEETGHKISTVSKYLKKNYGITPQRKVDLLVLSRLANEGKTTKEMAEHFNVHPSAISY
jgi:DNA-binding CsgD family transcriptional regulator